MARNNFEGGVTDANITTANAGGINNDNFDAVGRGTGATAVFDSSGSAHQTLAARLQTGSTATQATLTWTTTVGSQTTIYVRFYFFAFANPAASWRIFSVTTAGGASLSGAIDINANNTLSIIDGSGSPVLTTTATATGEWVRVEAKFVGSASVGQVAIRLFKGANLESITPTESLTSAANRNVPSPMALYDFGHGFNVKANMGPIYLDDVATDPIDWVGPSGNIRNNFEGGSNGATITTANAGGTGNSQFNAVALAAPSAIIFDNTRAAHGTLSCKQSTGASIASCSLRWTTAGVSQTTSYIRFYIYITANPPATQRLFTTTNAAQSQQACALSLLTNGRLALANGVGTTVLTTTQSVNLNGWTRIEIKIVTSTTTGQLSLRMYKSMDSLTADEDLTASPVNAGTLVELWDFGQTFGTIINTTTWYDDIAIGNIDWHGPLVKPVSLTLTATPTISIASTVIRGFNLALIATPTLVVTGRLTLQRVAVSLFITPQLLVIGTSPSYLPVDIFFRYPYPQAQYPFRIIAQEILSGKVVDWDLPVQDDFSYTVQLSGPTTMSGAFPPEIVSIQELGLDGYSYFFHVEISGEVRATGVFLPPEHEETALNFTAEGFSSIPHYVTWGGQLSEIGIDPLVVVRMIWDAVQNNPRSNLGVVVSNTTSNKKLGVPAYTQITKGEDGVTTSNDIEAAPYELNWWEAPNCGDTLDNLATQTPFDFRERVSWNVSKTDVDLFIDLGYPRIGIPRDGLLFTEDNVLEIVPIQESDDTYASEILVIGAGEGSATIRGYAAETFANRIRKVHVITDKTITTVERANAVASTELGLRKGSQFSIDELVAHARHQNASIGEYDVGDDVYVQVDIPWLPLPHIAWYRILSITYEPVREIVRLKVALSSSFNYSAEPTPPPTTVSDDVLAAQAIMVRMKSDEVILEDWTWIDCPAYVTAWNDVLISQWESSGQPNAEVWLQAYVIARI